jgi:hypothetical protein
VNIPSIPRRQLYLQRKNALYTERATFFSHWRELSQFYMPRSGRFFVTDRNKGDKRFNQIYDNTATRALRILAAGLMSGMTSPARPWFRLATRDRDLMDSTAVKRWLNQVTELMRAVFAQSNTYRALHTMYEDIGCFGTGTSILTEDFNDVIRMYPLAIGEYALATSNRQEVNTMVREYEWTVAQIVQEFVQQDPRKKSGSLDWSNVSTQVKNLWDNGKGLDTWVPLVHIIEPRADREFKNRDAKNMPIASCTFELNGERGSDVFLRESGFMRFPVLAARWAAQSGDVYATTCPGMEALGDTKQLQHGQLRKSQGIDYMVKPPIQVPAGTKGYEVDLLPGGLSVANMTGPSGGIKTAFEVKLDLSGQLEDIKDVRSRIGSTFYTDLFMMLAMDTGSQQPITAREVAERHEEKLLMLGPVLERLHNELLKPFIDLVFDKMLLAGIVPPPPPEMREQDIDVEFVSMLAQAQKAIGTQNIDRWTAYLGQVAAFKPDIMDKFNSDTAADKYADMLGVDPDLVVGSDEVAIIRKQRADVQKAQAAQAQAAQMAETAKTASQAQTTQPSALTDVMGTLTGYTGPGIANAI